MQKHNISSSKGMIDRSTISQEYTYDKFTRESKKHEEVIQSLELN